MENIQTVIQDDENENEMQVDLPSPPRTAATDMRSPNHVSMSELQQMDEESGEIPPASELTVPTSTEGLLNRYIQQLLYGCHSDSCSNPFCASNPAFQLSSAQEISNLAATLAKVGPVHLCPVQPSQAITTDTLKDSEKTLADSTSSNLNAHWSISKVSQLIQQSILGNTAQIMRILYSAFSSTRDILYFFEYDLDEGTTPEYLIKVKESYHLLTSKCSNPTVNSLMTATACLLDSLKLQGKLETADFAALCISLCNPALLDSNYHSTVLIRLFDLVSAFSTEQSVSFMEFIIRFFNIKMDDAKDVALSGKRDLQMLIGIIQHFITMRIYTLTSQFGYTLAPNKDDPIVNATKTLNIFNKINERFKCVSYEEFYNEAINENLEIKDDFPHWKAKEGFSFCNYSFILNPATKSDILKVESLVQMRHELQDAFFRAMFIGVNSPYLVLEIRRGYIIRDALYQLENKRPEDFRKQLKIQFVGEDAVDEGGVQKEFFQLAVREIFNPKYNLFTSSNNFHWFTIHPEPVEQQLLEEMRLVGILIGLAIYNGVILDIRFPVVLYKKLMGQPVDIDDLVQLDPVLAKSLKVLLEYNGDVENDFGRTFQIDSEIYGHRISVNLCHDGDKKSITNENRKEFVDLYVQFLLVKNIEPVFNSFKEGFDFVCKNSAIVLFRPEEIELLVCGSSSDMDFQELMNVTTYDGGYTNETQVIQWFWTTVLKFDLERKKRLLFFTTGSDRVPIGGLSKMTFCIAKNGQDSDRLPTSHTCFNVLLLPEYKTEEKLKDRLLTAIQNAEGFGLI